MKLVVYAWIESAMHSTFARASLGGLTAMLLLACWQFMYSYGCLSLLLPLVIFLVIAYGQFEYLSRRRSCVANALFRNESIFHALLTRKLFMMIHAGIIAVIFTLSLSSFAALASAKDWLFLLADAMLVVMLYTILRPRVESHAAVGMITVITKRLTVMLSFGFMMMFYIYMMFSMSSPEYIDPTSIETTLNQASAQVSSTCYGINIFLKSVQEMNATGWFYMVVGTGKLDNQLLQYLAWIVFFLNSALVFISMGRLTVESTAWCMSKTPKRGES